MSSSLKANGTLPFGLAETNVAHLPDDASQAGHLAPGSDSRTVNMKWRISGIRMRGNVELTLDAFARITTTDIAAPSRNVDTQSGPNIDVTITESLTRFK